jgi:hypothetical protein
MVPLSKKNVNKGQMAALKQAIFFYILHFFSAISELGLV